MNKRKLISRYAVFLLGIVIMSEPVLSYGYTIKQPIEFELSACRWKQILFEPGIGWYTGTYGNRLVLDRRNVLLL